MSTTIIDKVMDKMIAENKKELCWSTQAGHLCLTLSRNIQYFIKINVTMSVSRKYRNSLEEINLFQLSKVSESEDFQITWSDNLNLLPEPEKILIIDEVKKHCLEYLKR